MFLSCNNGLISAIFLRNLCVQKTKPVRSLRNLCVTIDQCAVCRFMMQFQQCRKQEMMSSIRLQNYDVTFCKQRHLKVKHHLCKGVSTCYNHRNFGKVSSINEGVVARFYETPWMSKVCITATSFQRAKTF